MWWKAIVESTENRGSTLSVSSIYERVYEPELLSLRSKNRDRSIMLAGARSRSPRDDASSFSHSKLTQNYNIRIVRIISIPFFNASNFKWTYTWDKVRKSEQPRFGRVENSESNFRCSFEKWFLSVIHNNKAGDRCDEFTERMHAQGLNEHS